jgi:polyhydroxyalkanoate synthesis regulator phasin
VPDAVAITGFVLAFAGVLAAVGVPAALIMRARAGGGDKPEMVSSWSELNDALQAEIQRGAGVMEKQRTDFQQQLEDMRDDYKRQLADVRADYQQQLGMARGRITELEAEVAALQRVLQGRGP